MTIKEKEIRALVRQVTTRASEAGMTITGYAAIFNEPTVIGDDFFSETILPGTFAQSIGADDIRALFDHDCGRVLGRNKAATLRLSEDGKGLAVEIDLPNTTDGNDVRELVSRGDVTGMSFCAYILEESWDYSGNLPKRTVSKAELLEVSVVTFPAYEGTSVSVRSRERAKERAPRPVTDNSDIEIRRRRMRLLNDQRA